jgi:hypothetical protein
LRKFMWFSGSLMIQNELFPDLQVLMKIS